MLQEFGGIWLTWMTAMAWQVTVLAVAAWALTKLLWRSSATLRYSLWLVVFIKLLLPPSFATPWSAGALLQHVMPHDVVLVSRGQESPPSKSGVVLGNGGQESPSSESPMTPSGMIPSFLGNNRRLTRALMFGWLLGAVSLLSLMLLQSRRYVHNSLHSAAPVSREVQTLADELVRSLGIRQPVSVRLSDQLPVPVVLGILHPVIMLPRTLVEELSQTQLRHILGHELAHVRRYDVLVAWVVSLILCVYWFHPAVWLANYCMRREREMACDDTVLYQTRQEGDAYARTLVRVAEVFRTPVPVGAGFLGMLEVSGNLLMRMQSCVDGMRVRKPGWGSYIIAGIFVILLLPMGVWTEESRAANVSGADQVAPVIVKLEPANSATTVDPALENITVTFDKDMAPGFSWTGGPPYFPETTGGSRWVDKRTCVLPVKLEPGKLYRVGFNSQSYQNFQSEAGVPLRPQVLVFTTQGSSPELMEAVKPPQVVSLIPENDAKDVRSDVSELVVTFDRPMNAGFSWTGGGENYPETIGRPHWSEDKKTCRLSVKLKAGWFYRLGLNSPSHNNFQNEYGVPLAPVPWNFTTAQ